MRLLSLKQSCSGYIYIYIICYIYHMCVYGVEGDHTNYLTIARVFRPFGFGSRKYLVHMYGTCGVYTQSFSPDLPIIVKKNLRIRFFSLYHQTKLNQTKPTSGRCCVYQEVVFYISLSHRRILLRLALPCPALPCRYPLPPPPPSPPHFGLHGVRLSIFPSNCH